MDATTIQNIITLPYTPTLWVYYINNGDRHACNKEALVKLTSNLVPALAGKIHYFIQRSIPFYIEVNPMSIKEISIDESEEILRMKKAVWDKKSITNAAIESLDGADSMKQLRNQVDYISKMGKKKK